MGLGGLKGGWVVAPKMNGSCSYSMVLKDNDAFSGPYSMQLLKDNELSSPHSVTLKDKVIVSGPHSICN